MERCEAALEESIKMEIRNYELRKHSNLLITASQAIQNRAIRNLKVCPNCGLEYGLKAWLSLELVGYQDFFNVSGEMRNCICKSTLFLVTNEKEK